MRRGSSGGGFRTARTVALVLAIVLSVGCATGRVSTPRSDPGAAAELTISPEASQEAKRLLVLAARVEPDLTALLQEGAERQDLLLIGLEHRVKSRASLERKIQTQMLQSNLSADEVQISDVVRYTVLLNDEPPGDYGQTAAWILQRADERGFTVQLVKNYWPGGDTYSGLNCVLATPQGLTWELQMHTIGSLAAKDEGHLLYEELRLPTTPIRRQRALFDRLAERWSWVKIPQGVLVAHSLHPKEEIILHPRP